MTRWRHLKRDRTYRELGRAIWIDRSVAGVDMMDLAMRETSRGVWTAENAVPIDGYRRATLQSAAPVTIGTELVVYEAETDRSLWGRPTTEFMDGRFEVAAWPLLGETPERQEIWWAAHDEATVVLPRVLSGICRQPGLAAVLANFAIGRLSDWRPIQSAPRKGEVLVLNVRSGNIAVSSYEDTPWRRGFLHRNGFPVTHWAPVPELLPVDPTFDPYAETAR